VLGAKIRAMQRIVLMRASLLALTRKLDAANQELKRISSLDGLTGVANRRYFDEPSPSSGAAPAATRTALPC
jgi:PleD family two-component response regulator